MSGTYKLTDDFAIIHDPLHYKAIVRDINFSPDDKRLPDVAICRVFSSREEAVFILSALEGTKAAAILGRKGGSVRSEAKSRAAVERNAKRRASKGSA